MMSLLRPPGDRGSGRLWGSTARRRARVLLGRRYPATVSVTWSQALAWRLRQHLLDPVGSEPVAGVVGRLGAVPAFPEPAAELAVRCRQQRSQAGDVARALAQGRVVKTFAFRGATHLLTPERGGDYLALRAASRMWELPSWQQHYGIAPSDWPRLRAVVREGLADGPLTQEELATVVAGAPGFEHLRRAFTDGSLTLLKPLAWQGDLCFGPPRDGHATFQLLEGNPRWSGLPDLEEAGRRAVQAYVHTYGPTTPEQVHYWLGEGLGAGRRRVSGWLDALGERLTQVDVDGIPALLLHDDLEVLRATPASNALRLLPGYDQWVLGPGTADAHVVPPARRALVSRQANLVVLGGVVSGTWSLSGDAVAVTWFAEAGPPPEEALGDEGVRLAAILGRPLEVRVQTS
jgi:hypothetical protein